MSTLTTASGVFLGTHCGHESICESSTHRDSDALFHHGIVLSVKKDVNRFVFPPHSIEIPGSNLILLEVIEIKSLFFFFLNDKVVLARPPSKQPTFFLVLLLPIVAKFRHFPRMEGAGKGKKKKIGALN